MLEKSKYRPNFAQKCFWLKIKILGKNPNPGKKSKF